MGHEVLDLLQAHALFNGPLHAHQTDAVLVLQQFPDGPHAAVAQMVDVVDCAAAVLQINQIADNFQNVIPGSLNDHARKQVFKQHPVTAQHFDGTAVFVVTALFNHFCQFYCGFSKIFAGEQLFLEKIGVTNQIVQLLQELIA